MTEGPGQVDDLVGWVERVYVESELARERAAAAVSRLESIVSSDFQGDPVTAYTEFVESLQRAEAQAKRLAEQVEPMRNSAAPVFEQWEAALAQFQNENMKSRSAARLDRTRQRYQRILAAIEPAQSEYAKLNAGLRDHALFLGNDFNPDAVADIRDDAMSLVALARELDAKFEECLTATQAYVETAALPALAAPAPGGAGSRFRRR